MPPAAASQNDIRIGVDVGGTFTDLVAVVDGELKIVKVPSTPPEFQRAVMEAVARVMGGRGESAVAHIVHGSTVATNALLQRAGEPVALITTEGFRDLLLIGRQNRPELYALKVRRAAPIVTSENCFTVRERVSAAGSIVEALGDEEIARVVAEIQLRKLRHVAVCLLFSFVNPAHEQRLGAALQRAGLTVTLSSDILPEFREYERGSTTAINAALRPTVQSYLDALQGGLGSSNLRIMHSGGGTFDATEAARKAAHLVLSGPAGGVIGAAFVAKLAGFSDVITYDMGGTSTDVATMLGGRPQWTTSTNIDGLPLAIPMFDINTVGAGGGSIAALDVGGALRVGPQSAGAIPGPACYGRGGTLPTVTDANLILGRIIPDHFLGGAMKVNRALAEKAVGELASAMGKSLIETALGIVRISESNMEHAIRAVTSQRGHDPRQFTLVSFGGAGGLHACGLADSLEIPRVLVPPYCGVLSALGMVVAPPVVDAARTVVQLGDALDDDRLAAEYGSLSGVTMDQIPYDQSAAVEVYADARFKGQSHEVKVQIHRPSRGEIEERFRDAYQTLYGHLPANRPIEIVTLRVRRIGKAPLLSLPELRADTPVIETTARVILSDGREGEAVVMNRAVLFRRGSSKGAMILIDPEATTFVSPDWRAEARPDGSVILERR